MGTTKRDSNKITQIRTCPHTRTHAQSLMFQQSEFAAVFEVRSENLALHVEISSLQPSRLSLGLRGSETELTEKLTFPSLHLETEGNYKPS